MSPSGRFLFLMASPTALVTSALLRTVSDAFLDTAAFTAGLETPVFTTVLETPVFPAGLEMAVLGVAGSLDVAAVAAAGFAADSFVDGLAAAEADVAVFPDVLGEVFAARAGASCNRRTADSYSLLKACNSGIGSRDSV